MSHRDMDVPGNPAILTDGERALVRTSAVLATGDLERVRAVLAVARSTAPASEIEEILLQSHLFLGFPATLEAFRIWREGGGGSSPAGSGTEASDRDRAESGPDREEVVGRGEELCRRVYGSAYESLRRNVRSLHPALDRWMVEDGYGKVLGRPELDPLRRELAVVGLLAVLGADSQLHSHLRGALRVGASPEQVEEALAVAGEFMDERALHASRETWSRVRDRW